MIRLPRVALCLTALFLLAPCRNGWAAEEKKPEAAKLTVAVLDFTAPDNAPKMGADIGEVILAMISGQPGYTLVERQTIGRTLQEHELNLTGVVDADKAIKIGKLAGAKIIVTGRIISLGDSLMITAKLIGTETTLVESLMVKGKPNGVDELAVELAGKVSEKLRTAGPKLVAAAAEEVDPLPALKERLKKKALPTVAIVVPEQHHGMPITVVVVADPRLPPHLRRALDPAVETEIKKLLIDCGFTVQDVAENELTDFARSWKADNVSAWPRGLKGVDVVIAGEALSEFGARLGNLVTCAARGEVNLISREDGKVVLADRTTVRAVDLSEQIAGKTALQKAGRQLGLGILEHFAKTLPDKK